MNKLTREELDNLRKNIKENRNEIIVSMGTCGIASGADKVYDFFQKELRARGLSNIIFLKNTGCLGVCKLEPIVKVKVENMPEILYGHVDENTANRIIDRHIMKKIIIEAYILSDFSTDIYK